MHPGGSVRVRAFTPLLNEANVRTEGLLQLIEDYRTLPCGAHSMWERWPERIDLQNFRRDGDYLGQLENADVDKYRKTWEYVVSVDERDYLSRFSEDGLFGVVAFPFGGRTITRDLLDSVLEINFLRRVLGWKAADPIQVCDIGAGYGRFAHRFAAAFPESYIWCTDAVAQSTFLCDFYIRFRKFADQARAVPLGELRSIPPPIDLAVNIHSWSECTMESIEFWLDRLVEWKARYLFVVPHRPEGLSMERDGTFQLFWPAVRAHGYELLSREPKYGALGENGIFAATYFLFERRQRS